MLSCGMIESFVDRATEDIFHGRNTRAARGACPRSLWSVAARKLDQLDSAEAINDLRVPPGNRLEKLSGDRAGEYSVRINDQFRICFRWAPDGPTDVAVTDYHLHEEIRRDQDTDRS